MLLQHQSVVGPSCLHNLCFQKFQRWCPLSMELTPCWHSRLFFITCILSVVFLKPTVSIRPSVPPSGSHKCLRFGLWSTLCTIKYFTYLLTYLLTISRTHLDNTYFHNNNKTYYPDERTLLQTTQTLLLDSEECPQPMEVQLWPLTAGQLCAWSCLAH